ncbi:tripartite tricarboxylate transporter TctB family protein [Anaerobacillus sp. MEB173]|uniref:tripartite tricarboxylate transporter TctB family protein n=1 Tax=Anaerobacillus sp. MEB173 TaxID=3383345 RepID=UPI003F8FE0BD
MSKLAGSTLFSFCLFLLFGALALEAMTFSRLAKFFPLYITVAGAILCLIYTIILLRTLVKKEGLPEELKKLQFTKPLKYLSWLLGYVVLVYIVGFLVATGLFLAAFLYLESKFSVVKTAISISIVLVCLILFSDVMNLYWPKSLLG